jgi:hypothetical protein
MAVYILETLTEGIQIACSLAKRIYVLLKPFMVFRRIAEALFEIADLLPKVCVLLNTRPLFADEGAMHITELLMRFLDQGTQSACLSDMLGRISDNLFQVSKALYRGHMVSISMLCNFMP